MRLAAIVPRVGCVGRFFRPFEDRELRVAAIDHNPAHRVLALRSANLTSINPVNHPLTSNRPVFTVDCSLSTVYCYSSICRFSGGSSIQSIFPIVSIARFSADDRHGSTVTTNGSACAG